jgi:hypothetical protein
MKVYAVYLGSGGAGLAFIPNVLLHVLGIPPTHEFWIRVFGALAIVLAAKGAYGAYLNFIPSLQFDCYTRACFGTFLAVLVVIGIAPRQMLIFAIIDLLASVWTQLALFADRRAARSQRA